VKAHSIFSLHGPPGKNIEIRSWKIDYYPVQEKKGENQENGVSPFSSGSFRD